MRHEVRGALKMRITGNIWIIAGFPVLLFGIYGAGNGDTEFI